MKKTTNPIRISIVTPSFNQGQYIEATICSVLEQGYPNLEYIVIDGGSTDNSVEIIRRYEKHLAYWVSEKDRGQAHAINKGFAKASGQVFAYLNSDDLYAPQILRSIAERYVDVGRPTRFFHACSVEEFDQSGTNGCVRPRQHNRMIDWLEYRAYLHQPGVFWSSQLHEAVGGFDESYHYAFDRKFFMEAIYRGHWLTVDRDRVAARFRRHPASKTESIGEQNQGFAEEFQRISAEFLSQYSALGRLGLRFKSFQSGLLDYAQRVVFEEQRTDLTSLLTAAVADPRLLVNRFYLGMVRESLVRCKQHVSTSRSRERTTFDERTPS